MAGQNGGARPGAGRKKGAGATKTQELVAKATAGGVTPLEVLIGDMRYFYQLADEHLSASRNMADDKEREEYLKNAIKLKSVARDCAVQAAPYIHPKLQSTTAKVEVTSHEASVKELLGAPING